MGKIKKAVLPVAGLGTRFLPATKTVPKEMLPIVDKPSLFYVVEEAVEAGIEEIILVAGRNKTAIEDFFDRRYELEDLLAQKGQHSLLKTLGDIHNMAHIVSIRQKEALGLGHAVSVAESVVDGQDFVVLLGDELTFAPRPGEPRITQQLIEAQNRLEDQEAKDCSVVSIMEVPQEDLNKYGIVALSQSMDITGVWEKPQPHQAPSHWALSGRYLFKSSLFEALKETPKGQGGEIQLSDAMTKLAQREKLHALPFVGKRHDVGDKWGYLRANIELGLEHPEVGPPLKRYLKEFLKNPEKWLEKDL